MMRTLGFPGCRAITDGISWCCDILSVDLLFAGSIV